jgi:cholinesterase
MQLRFASILVFGVLVQVILGLPAASQDITRASTEWVIGQAVNTTSGPVSGHPASNETEVSEYLGIPYAIPPIDQLRWQPPIAYTGEAPINGTSFVGYSDSTPQKISQW